METFFYIRTCSPNKFDAIFSATNRGSNTFIVVGPYVYQIDSLERNVEPSWPRISKEEFGVEFIHEAVQHSDGFLYLFEVKPWCLLLLVFLLSFRLCIEF